MSDGGPILDDENTSVAHGAGIERPNGKSLFPPSQTMTSDSAAACAPISA